MRSDYFTALTKRTVTKVDDGGGSYTETTSDTTFQGKIQLLSGNEILVNQQINRQASARLDTDVTLSMTDRVIDGSDTYEVVFFNPNNGYPYYLLKLK